MLSKGTGVQSQFNANQPHTMVGVVSRHFPPPAIDSMQTDPTMGGVKFIPGESFVSITDKGTVILGTAPNSRLLGPVMRGASLESFGADPVYFQYEKNGPIPVGTSVTTWVKVVSAPDGIVTNGVAINNETGKATCYDNTATSGYFTGGEAGLLSALQAVTAGSLTLAVDGGAAAEVTGIDLSTAESMEDVATLIEAKLSGVFVNYNVAENVFIFTSTTAGASSAVVVTAGATGTNLHVATLLNTVGGTATAGSAAGSVPSGYTAATGIQINRWSASNPLLVEISIPKVSV